jgi:hypothetical protein
LLKFSGRDRISDDMSATSGASTSGMLFICVPSMVSFVVMCR